jgi:hypothetical protein
MTADGELIWLDPITPLTDIQPAPSSPPSLPPLPSSAPPPPPPPTSSAPSPLPPPSALPPSAVVGLAGERGSGYGRTDRLQSGDVVEEKEKAPNDGLYTFL